MIFTILPIVLIITLLIVALLSGYVRASTNEAFIITGLHKKPRVLIGRSGIKIPFFEKKDYLNLSIISIDVKTSSEVQTADFINIFVDSVVNIQIDTEDEQLALASRNFLNKRPEYIADVAREVLEGNVREIVALMKLKEMVGDRQKFAELIKQNAEPDLREMGLKIISFNVQSFRDKEGVVNDLGTDNVMAIRQDAAISKENAEKEIKKAKAEAQLQARQAEIEMETEIAMQENALAIRKAELKRNADIEQAKADAAYEIQEQEQRKLIEVANAEANLAKKEKEIEIEERQVAINERKLEAEINKKAEAEKFAAQQKADAELYARQREAEAKKYEAIQEAEATKIDAEAWRYRSEQDAIGIKATGEAEAEAISKKAEAMNQIGQAEIISRILEVLPEMTKNAAEPLKSVDKIVMYGDGNTSKLISSVISSGSQVIDGLNEATGLDLKALMSTLGHKQSGGDEVEDEDQIQI